MIRINKDLNDLPPSLLSDKTHQKRQELIERGEYIKTESYNACYRADDIKKQLKQIHNGKCAYCEQRIEQFNVEHYRPKTKYYWLAFSWDNLLLACPRCNQCKKDSFPLKGTQSTNPPSITNDEANKHQFNALSLTLNETEQPILVNPTLENPEDFISFSLNGEITSSNERYSQTIEICKLSRPGLVEQRKKIINSLKYKMQEELFRDVGWVKLKQCLTVCMRGFISDSREETNDFLGFRRYIINSSLKILLKDITQP